MYKSGIRRILIERGAMMLSLTSRLIFEELKKTNGRDFLVRELAEKIGITDRTYYNQVKKLEKMGLIRRDSVRSKYSRIVILEKGYK